MVYYRPEHYLVEFPFDRRGEPITPFKLRGSPFVLQHPFHHASYHICPRCGYGWVGTSICPNCGYPCSSKHKNHEEK